MHQILSKRPVYKAIRLFKRLYFNLIILNIVFDATRILGYFYNKYIKRNYPYPLADKYQATLITIFKYIIFIAKRRYRLSIKALVIAIQTD